MILMGAEAALAKLIVAILISLWNGDFY
jgi:hypothetical protein